MEIKEMNMEQIESRMAEIRGLLDSEDADIEEVPLTIDSIVPSK